MTDNEIIKALENFQCVNCDDNCWRENEYDINCPLYLAKATLDLINRKDAEIDILIRKKETLRDEIAEQQAEIERLNKEVDRLKEMVGD